MSPVVTVPDSKGGREVLTLVVLLVLAALWAAVLLPPLLRSRLTRSVAADSIGEFNYKLDVLSRTNGTAPQQPAPRTPRVLSRAPAFAIRPSHTPSAIASRPTLATSPHATKRRGDVLRVLVVAVGLTMGLAYFTGAPTLWGVQVFADVCLVAFLGIWAWVRNLQADRAQTVRFLPQGRAPELALRRTGSS
jgi:hypothetical protein